MYVKGVGPARAAFLQAKGLETVEHLLQYAPFRYEDRSNMKTIKMLAPGEMATVLAEVRSAKASGFRKKALGLFEAEFTDASRAVLLCKWFHGSYLADKIVPGMKFALFGKVEFDNYRGELQMMHPEMEPLSEDDEEGESALHVGRVVPVYEAAGKVSTRVIRTLMHRVLASIPPLEERLPEGLAAAVEAARPLDGRARDALPSGGFRSADVELLPLARSVPFDPRRVLLAGVRGWR